MTMLNHLWMPSRMPPKTLDQWLASIEANHPQEIDLGLERIRHVAHRLKLTELCAPVITVAGTNGKGSTIAYMVSILKQAGYQVGAYTSPHFIDYNERVCVNGNPVSSELFCDAFSHIDEACQYLELTLTYFEYGTLAALWIFQQLIDQQKIDVVLLEVGLGGRLDAVNIIDPNIAIVTTIALDHESWLGSSRNEIGTEKAGIYRKNIPAIFGEWDMPETVQARIDELAAPRYQMGKEFKAQRFDDTWCWSGKSFDGSTIEVDDLSVPSLPFDNASTAIQALQLLNLPISTSDYQQGIKEAKLTGRFQSGSYKGREILIDVAHNPHAAEHLCRQLSTFQNSKSPARTIRCVVGMLADKDVTNTLTPLSEVVEGWYAGSLNEPRGLSAEQLTALVPDLDMQCFSSIEKGLNCAVDESDETDLILVVGSFFTAAEALKACRETFVE